ncbi:hypothetical protein, partial [Deinococcus sp. ME38]|uniref:hypothetical protein n=1 Tax=Deinococcus sp. ME38 TaxID=3400344 RepID=UPI003B5C18D0
MDLPKLNSILGHADLARAMQTMTERELRQLAVNSIEWGLGQCQVDPLQFARPLDAILLDNSNAGNVDWESLRALADELDEQVDIHNESFAHGPPESTESAKFQLKFQLARMLAALCEGGDRGLLPRIWTVLNRDLDSLPASPLEREVTYENPSVHRSPDHPAT